MIPEMWLVSHPDCDTPFLVPETALGRTVHCPNDGAAVHLPHPPIRESETLRRFGETDWLQTSDIIILLRYMGKRLSIRKKRLFAVACCSRIWDLIVDERSREAVRAAEKYADGLIRREDLAVACLAGRAPVPVWERGYQPSIADNARSCAANAARYVARDQPETVHIAHQVSRALAYSLGLPSAREAAHQAELTSLFRDITGNPFRAVAALDSAWLTWKEGTVHKLATSIYQEKNFADLPVLADALEEAGCTNPDLLLHCREDGEHVRGCWAVDTLLGKK
jgi:hypothetical protein